MHKFISLILFFTLIVSCTKEVPESEKQLTKSTNEKEIRAVVDNFTAAYNSGGIDNISNYFTSDYGGFVPDLDSAVGIAAYQSDLRNFRKQYPENEMHLKIEEVYISEEFAAVQTFGSYTTLDPVEGKKVPVYSERSIKLLRKVKNEGWKIFKSLSIPAFSYE